MSLIPANPAAETIITLRSQNNDIDTQILTLAKTQAKNLEVIQSLEQVAEWSEPELES